MRVRKSYIVEDQVLDASGTVIKDLDFSDPITEIIVGVRGKKHDHANIDPLISRNISKIEVVDGTDVLFSMNMELAQALQLYTTRRMPFIEMTCNHYGINNAQVRLAFGRNRSDNEWALDPTKHVNPQIRVTYAFEEGAGFWKDNEQKLTIAALLSENPPRRPSAFLMAKEFYSWTKATSGDETIDMDRTHPYRMLLWSIKDCRNEIYDELTKIKISCDMDKFIPVNETMEDLFWENANWTGLLFQQTEAMGDGATTDVKAWYPFARNRGGTIESWDLGAGICVKRPYSGYITVDGFAAAHAHDLPSLEAMKDGTRAIVNGRGWEFNYTEHVRFGNLDDPEEFFDPRDFKSARLIFTQGGSQELVSRVVSQQLRPY